jgi:hypothetical protein
MHPPIHLHTSFPPILGENNQSKSVLLHLKGDGLIVNDELQSIWVLVPNQQLQQRGLGPHGLSLKVFK